MLDKKLQLLVSQVLLHALGKHCRRCGGFGGVFDTRFRFCRVFPYWFEPYRGY